MELWEQLEDHVLKVTGGHKTAASGRLKQKGDIRTTTLLIECKQRSYLRSPTSVTVQKDWLDTTRQHAIDAGLVPVLAFGPTFKEEPDLPIEAHYLVRRNDRHLFHCEDSGGYAYVGLKNSALKEVPEHWYVLNESCLRHYCKTLREIHDKLTKDAALKPGAQKTLSNKNTIKSRPLSGGQPIRSRGFRK